MKKLVKKSYYGSIGYLENKDSISTLQSYLQFNLPVLKEFKGHIFAFTYKEANIDILKPAIHELLPNAEIILLPENRGHNFGTADLDNAIFDYCKVNNIEWLCKSANDIIIQDWFLKKKVPKADFYYLNGIGFGGMVKYGFDNQKIINEDFYPQTNFYFINVSKTDYLTDKNYLNETYKQIQNIPNYNGKVWEYIEGWSCEDFLAQTIERNNLSKHHLVPEDKYITLLETVKANQIHDCSHKNIMVEGVCHYQYPDKNILIVS